MANDARQRSLMATEKSKAAARTQAAAAESEARNAPITGTANAYDYETGDYFITTPDGGTIRAQSLTNGALVGRRLPVQRFAGSQTSTINAPPPDADSGWIVAEMEALQRDLFILLGTEERTIGIESPTANYVYPVVTRNDAPRVFEALHVVNTNDDGSTATNGTATLMINGVEAAVDAAIAVGDRVGLKIDTVGTGIFSASIYARRVG
jgi:hypothetical protein